MVKDHLGNEYNNIAEMCEHWGIYKNTFRFRLKSGWSLHDTLTIPVRTKNKACADHLGNKFNSIKEMCDYWKLSISTFKRRIYKGYSIEESLTGKHANKVKDHLNNEFNTVQEMLEYWNISKSLYQKCFKKGMSFQQIVEYKNKKYRDHLNNEFESLQEMCNYWDISPSTFYKRRNNSNFELKDALETPVRNTKKFSIDHLGNKFFTELDMCLNYGINNSLFGYRIHAGWTLKMALESKAR